MAGFHHVCKLQPLDAGQDFGHLDNLTRFVAGLDHLAEFKLLFGLLFPFGLNKMKPSVGWFDFA